jgi:stage V sporulation protein SpoVS
VLPLTAELLHACPAGLLRGVCVNEGLDEVVLIGAGGMRQLKAVAVNDDCGAADGAML